MSDRPSGQDVRTELIVALSRVAYFRNIVDPGRASAPTVVAQFLPGFRGARWSFPARNKTMSAYAHATVIAEATEQSGTKHQALEAVALRLLLQRSVAEGTTWGRALADRPDVFVVDSAGEAIDLTGSG